MILKLFFNSRRWFSKIFYQWHSKKFLFNNKFKELNFNNLSDKDYIFYNEIEKKLEKIFSLTFIVDHQILYFILKTQNKKLNLAFSDLFWHKLFEYIHFF